MIKNTTKTREEILGSISTQDDIKSLNIISTFYEDGEVCKVVEINGERLVCGWLSERYVYMLENWKEEDSFTLLKEYIQTFI